MKTRKLWLGLGAVALSTSLSPATSKATSSSAALDAVSQATSRRAVVGWQLAQSDAPQGHHHGAGHAAPATSGSEGGEGGEGSAAAASADARLEPLLRFYRDVQLVRGHLLVGDELIKDGRWADALPHFLHPVEELYDKLAPVVKSMKLKPFLTQLKALAQTVKAQNEPAYRTALAALEARLDAVDTAVKSAKPKWLPFAVSTALETMRSALGEYGEAIEDGRFAKAVEYQDSRGFVWQAERLLASVNGELTAQYPDVAKKLPAEIAALKAGWPAVLPPPQPVFDASKAAAQVSRIELAVGRVN